MALDLHLHTLIQKKSIFPKKTFTVYEYTVHVYCSGYENNNQ